MMKYHSWHQAEKELCSFLCGLAWALNSLTEKFFLLTTHSSFRLEYSLFSFSDEERCWLTRFHSELSESLRSFHILLFPPGDKFFNNLRFPFLFSRRNIMALHNPNNWHWVNKDASAWARDYLDKTLTTISAEENGVTAKIEKILNMDGDVDVSQRKGKVITLFDVQLQLEYEGP